MDALYPEMGSGKIYDESMTKSRFESQILLKFHQIPIKISWLVVEPPL
jgi:hypothetical protein